MEDRFMVFMQLTNVLPNGSVMSLGDESHWERRTTMYSVKFSLDTIEILAHIWHMSSRVKTLGTNFIIRSPCTPPAL